MDHTTDTRSQFHKHTVVGNVLYQTSMTASFREFCFDIIPGIRRKLLDRQAHLPAVLIKGYNLCFMLITKFEKLFGIDWSISPCDLTYVNQAFYSRLNLQECAI